MRKTKKQRGFSLIEVLLLVTVLGIVGGAAGQAMIVVAKVPSQTDMHFQIETRLISKMETIRALDFDDINDTLTDSVPIGPQSTIYARTVTVTNIAGSGGGTPDSTFKQITITCGGQSVTMFVAK